VNRFFVVTAGVAATFGLLSSCADAPKLSVRTAHTAPESGSTPPAATLPAGVSLPNVSLPNVSLPNVSLPDVSLPDVSGPGLSLPDVSLPTDFTIPEQTIDLMIQQFQAAGLKVDRACFETLLSDPSLRKLVEAGSHGTPTPELIQKFLACITP